MQTTLSRVSFVRLLPALVLASACFLPGQTPVSLAQAKKKDSSEKVMVQAAATKTDAAGNQQITMKLIIEKGWHLYANPLGNPTFDGNETKVTVTGQTKPLDVKTAYPPGKMADIYGQKVKIYEGEVMLITTVRRAPGDNAPLQVRINVNACDSHTCLLPGEIKLNVPAYTQ